MYLECVLITSRHITQYSTSHPYTAGEKFTQDEMDEMLSAAVDKEKETVLYRDFVTYMLPETVQ